MSKVSEPLRFDVFMSEDEQGRSVAEGQFSRDMDAEEEMDELQGGLDRGVLSEEAALAAGRKLLAADPDNLELRNFVGCRFWALELRDEAADVWDAAYKLGAAHIPKGFKGRISWNEVDNRSFMRCCYGHLLGLSHRRRARQALALAQTMLRWNPNDNQGVRFLVPDLQAMTGDLEAALESYLSRAPEQPSLWYSAALIVLRGGEFVRACTYVRRGIASNPYVAEALTGRTLLADHLYWHGSNLYGVDFALGYLKSPLGASWTDEELDFVDWVFNSAAVLRERAGLMEAREGLTYAVGASERIAHSRHLAVLIEGMDDTLSKVLVRQVTNRWGDSVWPWYRTGMNHRVARRAEVTQH